MPSIAIIDDRPDQSDTVSLNIQLELEKLGGDLSVISSLPFKDIEYYFSYIDQNDVRVLILDERLNDQPINDEGTVGYKGSDLIVQLRKRLKDFPIFTLTVIPGDPDLVEMQNQYEQIISRDDFYQHAEKYVPIFVRATKTYFIDHMTELSAFNDLTRLVANGKANDEDIQQLKALQVKLELPLASFDDRKAWLDEYERQIIALDELNSLIKHKLESGK